MWQVDEWASRLSNGDAEKARRAALTESEFRLSWIAIDPATVVALCEFPKANDLGAESLH